MAPSKNPRARLLHIRDEIESIALVMKGVTYAEYESSYLVRRAVERALEIVSEAAKALPSELRTQHAEVPWGSIIGIGNILRHEYQRLDDQQLWEIATVHLPRLHPIVLRMIAEEDG